MSDALIGALRVNLGLESAAFFKGLAETERKLGAFGKKLRRIGAQMSSMGQNLTVGLTLPIVAFGAASIKAAQESADAFGQVQAALTSMGNASGRSLEQLGDQADKLMRNSLFDDDQILRDVTANMLTFGNVAGENFDRAQQAVVDMATRLKMDLQPATIMIGKALNDPVKGIAALSRAGIQFTAQQKAQIKAMVAAGNAAGAQAIMLAELERQFGGAGKAARDKNPWKALSLSLGELSETIGKRLTPYLLPLVEKLDSLAKSFDDLSPATQNFIMIGAGIAAVLGPVLLIVGGLVSAIGALLPLLAAPVVAAAAPFIALAAAIGAVVFVFRDELGPVVEEFAKTWKALFGPGGPLENAGRNFGEFVGRTFRAVGELIHGVVGTVTNILKALAALLRGDFSAAFGFAWKAVKAAVGGIVAAFAEMFPDVVGYAKATVEGVAHWFGSQFDKIVEKNRRDLEAMTGFFKGMWDAVVGHSYVPDMVLGIEKWFARLDAGMVTPAKNATKKVKAEFEKLRDEVARILGDLIPEDIAVSMGLESDIATLTRALKASRDPAEQATLRAAIAQLHKKNEPTMGLTVPTLADLGDTGVADRQFEQFMRVGQIIGEQHVAAFEAQRERIASVLRAGWGDLMKGDLKGALSKWLEAWASQGLEKAFNSVVDILQQIFGSMGQAGASSSGGDWLSSALSFLPKLFGFAQGGSFEIGGSGGIDSKIAMMRVTPGETGAIWKKGEGPAGGAQQIMVVPSPYFDVHVTDLATPIAAAAGARAVSQANAIIPREMSRSGANRLGRPR